MPGLGADRLLSLLLIITAVLFLQFLLLIAVGLWLQIRRQRRHRFRIRCHQRWEQEIVDYLYDGKRDTTPFQQLSPDETALFTPFLLRVLGTLAGSEGESVRELYVRLGLSRDLAARLRSRSPKVRAQAALEVGSFQVEEHYPRLLALLSEKVPFVAYSAARGLSGSHRIEFSGPVVDWVHNQDVLQQERLLWLFEGFGEAFLPWLEDRLRQDRSAPLAQRDRITYALTAQSTRSVGDGSFLLAMLGENQIEVQAATLKALGALGNPDHLQAVLPFAHHADWILRAQAVKAIGVLAGRQAVPLLLQGLCDSVFDVRRNSAQALARLGSAGMDALRTVVQDPAADPFARDLAVEHLHWYRQGALS
jgi:HEAT repeat protein